MTDIVASSLFVGVDLAQREDYTAIAVAEKVRFAEAAKPELHVRRLERLRGVSYPQVADRVAEILDWPVLHGARCLVDATGVGRAVVDMMRDRRLNVEPVVITSGNDTTGAGNEHHVPKRDLVAAVQILLQTGRLRVSREIREAETFASELGNFAVAISTTGRDTYAAAGTGHDDLVIAVALTAWAVSRGAGADDWAAYYRKRAAPVVDGVTV